MTQSPRILILSGKGAGKDAINSATAAIRQKFNTSPVKGIKALGIKALVTGLDRMRSLIASIEQMNPDCHFVLVNASVPRMIQDGRVWVFDDQTGVLLQVRVTTQTAEMEIPPVP